MCNKGSVGDEQLLLASLSQITAAAKRNAMMILMTNQVGTTRKGTTQRPLKPTQRLLQSRQLTQ
jgi:hypothetical protein